MTALLRAALAGAATGGRGFTGLAALTLATPSLPVAQPDRTLSTGWAKGAATFLAASEMVLDKLPQAPSRLEPPGIGLRCASAAAAGVIIARRAPQPADRAQASSTARTVACAAVATAAAVGASWLGVRWRTWAAGRIGHDYVGAGLEDVLAASLAALSTRG